jgi:D-glycero-D-manno-heptose 1,7-bisphosphate phosphatase
MQNKVLIILDRDGVLIEPPVFPNRYILNSKEIVLRNQLMGEIARLQRKMDFAVATNQQCVEKGLISQSELLRIHSLINLEIVKRGGLSLTFYTCPHLAEKKCQCRKPKAGLLLAAISGAPSNPPKRNCYFIGDQVTDEKAAQKANINFFYATEECQVIETLRSIESSISVEF